jgi:Bacterial Ig domain
MKSLALTLFLLASFASASTSNGIVTITAPADGSTVATPVTVTANAVPPPTCPAGIASLRVYPTSSNLLFKVFASSFSQSFILNPVPTRISQFRSGINAVAAPRFPSISR